VSVGTTATYFYSLGITIYIFIRPEFHTPVFFETSTYLITFIALGKAIEAYARGKTSSALTDLLALRVKETVRVIRDEKGNILQEEKISLKHVKVGNTLKVEAGQTIPTDGIVVEGRTTVNEAMLTGESVPRERGPNDEVIGGTINIDGN
jgi:Cu+-exporting ATPase